jgi:uncharacterized membrane protein
LSFADKSRIATVWLWAAVVLSLFGWYAAGYSWLLCILAAAPLLAPLRGLIRGHRYTYAWASLFAMPYVAFSVTELLANPAARAVASLSLVLVFAWFCAMVLYLRASRGRPG